MVSSPQDDAVGNNLTTPDASAVPPLGARILAFAAIVIAGVCGGLIGWAVADLQGASAATSGLVGLLSALMAAGGTAVVAVLALRAMHEWKTIEERRNQAT